MAKEEKDSSRRDYGTKKMQTYLFNYFNPLEERLGTAFWDELPKTAGVYKMYSSNRQLLYVGKAKNLRNRLLTYRRVNTQNASRKVVRLVRHVHHIEIEQMENEERALLRENELLREMKPPYNVAKKQPETYYYIGLKPQFPNLEIRLTMKESPKSGEYFYGAFKGHTLVRGALGALIRLLMIINQKLKTPFDFPPVITRKLVPWFYRYKWPATAQEQMREEWEELLELMEGKSTQLLDHSMEEIEDSDLLTGAFGKLILEDIARLMRFYERCSHRNQLLREAYEIKTSYIPQHKIDDLLIRHAFDRKEKPNNPDL